VCPTQAITFGNINDETSRVAKLKSSERNYEMLQELNLRPRTSYLARVRNENEELA
jgi:Fe-S-cluster-containing dehydrogenase component